MTNNAIEVCVKECGVSNDAYLVAAGVVMVATDSCLSVAHASSCLADPVCSPQSFHNLLKKSYLDRKGSWRLDSLLCLLHAVVGDQEERLNHCNVMGCITVAQRNANHLLDNGALVSQDRIQKVGDVFHVPSVDKEGLVYHVKSCPAAPSCDICHVKPCLHQHSCTCTEFTLSRFNSCKHTAAVHIRLHPHHRVGPTVATSAGNTVAVARRRTTQAQGTLAER